MSDTVNYQQLWDLAEANVRALEQERNELARKLGEEVARTQMALAVSDDWARAYNELLAEFEAYKKAHP